MLRKRGSKPGRHTVNSALYEVAGGNSTLVTPEKIVLYHFNGTREVPEIQEVQVLPNNMNQRYASGA